MSKKPNTTAVTHPFSLTPHPFLQRCRPYGVAGRKPNRFGAIRRFETSNFRNRIRLIICFFPNSLPDGKNPGGFGLRQLII